MELSMPKNKNWLMQ